jgi:hypothetical protein
MKKQKVDLSQELSQIFKKDPKAFMQQIEHNLFNRDER